VEEGHILDALCQTTGWHRKHAVRALRGRVVDKALETEAPRERKRVYGALIKDAPVRGVGSCVRQAARGDDPDPCAGTGAPLAAQQGEQAQLLTQPSRPRAFYRSSRHSPAAGGRRRRAGLYSAIPREVPIRTFNDWNDPVPGFCEVAMVAHGGTAVAGSFIQTLPMVDVATDGPSACRWSIATVASSSRRTSAPSACSLARRAASTSTTTVHS
jgi:hypothetical protein